MMNDKLREALVEPVSKVKQARGVEVARVARAARAARGSKGSKGSKGSDERTKVDIDQAFEALMDNRGVAQNMRQKLRNLDPRVKQHFINNESELEKLSGAPAPVAKASEPTSHHTLGAVSGLFGRRPPTGHASRKSISGITAAEQKRLEEPFDPTQGIPDATAGKRARPRSRTFGLGKDKERSSSPTKKQKAGDSPTQPPPSPEKKKTMRLKNTLLGQPASNVSAGDTLPTKGLRGGTIPASEFVTHLTLATAPSRKKDVGMKDVALPKLHKLRLYLRNETLRWVEEFVVLGGMNALIHVLYRCLDLEWREEHEDSVLHELLLCLKAISTCRKALVQLETVEEEFFTRLVDVIFDEERKGPSEFTTRGLVFSLLFTYMAAAPGSFTQVKRGEDTRAIRARRILGYLSDKLPEESKRPIEFIDKIHTKRPYKRWYKEVNNVTKEVFWIFCHHDNVITVEMVGLQQGEPYEARHFPHERPPVPAAPYVGGVEWEATTYLATHLDLLNGIIASIETREERNVLRTDFKNSGWEKVMGRTLRTCKERLHGCSAVHDALKTWIKAAREDSWCTIDVETRNSPNGGGRVGLVPSEEGDQNNNLAIRENPAKRKSVVVDAPQVELDLPTLNLGARVQADGWAF
ncbi:armadillo-type protein [Terfezia claveryi]|nr:armadillo-type protein [Terfezia claveryi]